MKKKVLSMVLVVGIIVSLLSAFPVGVSAEASGTCGDGLTWTLRDTGKLVIKGEGDMTSAPWLEDYKSDITEIAIRRGVTSIFKGAFNGCTNLLDVDIAETVTTIGGNAFYKCEQLTTVHLPESVSTVGVCAFGYCTNLEGINFPNGVTVVGDSMFFRCLNLKEVTLPDTITDIEQLAFYACTSLEHLELPEGLKTIGREAFAFTAFANLVIPESVKSISSSAFDYDSGITLNVYAGSYALEYAQKYNIPYVIIEREKTPAEKLCDLINEQAPNSCTVDLENQRVTLLSDVRLTQTLEIPTGGAVSLDIGDFDIYGANDLDAINIPNEATVNLYGTGTIKGGNATENGYSGGNGISNSGTLLINGPTLIGGDAPGDYGDAGAGVETYGAALNYFAEGLIQAGEGYYRETVMFERLKLTVVKESDDGINYTVAKNPFFNDKRYLKAIKISSDLSASAKLSAILNEIEPETCNVVANKVTLNKDFSCPYTIEIPEGNMIVLDFNGHNVTTDDSFIPFTISEQAEIIFKGEGVLTNKEKTSGGMDARASLISNEGSLTINGITVIGVGLNGIHNAGTLTVESGKITVSDYSSGKNAIINSGFIEVFGGEIIGGNATRDGNDGGDGILAMSGVTPSNGTYPVTLYGGILCGGNGCGDGENGRAVSTKFNIGDVCIAYESADGENYYEIDDTESYAKYLKIVNKNNYPEIEDGDLGDLGNPSTKNIINTNNVTFDGEKVTFDILLTSNETVTGNVYVVVYEGETPSLIKPYTAEPEIPVSVECANDQTITVFWWNTVFAPLSLPAGVEFE